MPIFQIPRLGCGQSRVGLDTFVWSGGQAMNLHFRPQGPASYLDDRRSKQHPHSRQPLVGARVGLALLGVSSAPIHLNIYHSFVSPLSGE